MFITKHYLCCVRGTISYCSLVFMLIFYHGNFNHESFPPGTIYQVAPLLNLFYIPKGICAPNLVLLRDLSRFFLKRLDYNKYCQAFASRGMILNREAYHDSKAITDVAKKNGWKYVKCPSEIKTCDLTAIFDRSSVEGNH